MLEWEAVPQSGIPYVHIGFSIVLYNSRSLFTSDNSDLLPKIQYIRLNERSGCFLLAWMHKDSTRLLKMSKGTVATGSWICCSCSSAVLTVNWHNSCLDRHHKTQPRATRSGLNPEDEGTTTARNVDNRLASDTASHPRRPQSSTCPWSVTFEARISVFLQFAGSDEAVFLQDCSLVSHAHS